ncbi:MAG TPA: hypothetical protein VNJ07_10465 [Chitinophagales bacterium]|nr:hypothetical protein [Chitinophagales bacterium]
MENSLHTASKPKLHIYPFSGEWILINDFDKTQNRKSFTCVNEALNFAREILKSFCLDYEIVIHSRNDSLPHFRITG